MRQAFERADDAGLGVDAAVLAAAVGEQVRVAQVGHDVTGAGYWPSCTRVRLAAPETASRRSLPQPLESAQFSGAPGNCADSRSWEKNCRTAL